MQSKIEQIGLQDLLQFYKTAGVEDALSDTGFNAFAADLAAKIRPASATAPLAAAPAAKPQSKTTEHIPHETWLSRAAAAAQSAQNLVELKQRIAEFDGCNLKFTAKNTCIADGSAPQPLMIIGEGPGAEEDRQALPFVGRAGQLLNAMLAAINFSRESRQNTETAPVGRAAAAERQLAYITNAVFWRPPGNRNPTAEEIALCLPFLQRQIELVRPKIMLTLGGVAISALLGGKQSVLRLRGAWRIYKLADGTEIPLLPSLHPAYLLRAPLQKKLAWADFLSVKMRLRELSAA